MGDGVEEIDNVQLMREVENEEDEITPYGAKCVADELESLRTRLAQIERQVIYRTADMPNWAEVWEKCRNGQCLWDARDAKAPEIAPDLRPDEPGRLWLPIIDPPEDT